MTGAYCKPSRHRHGLPVSMPGIPNLCRPEVYGSWEKAFKMLVDYKYSPQYDTRQEVWIKCFYKLCRRFSKTWEVQNLPRGRNDLEAEPPVDVVRYLDGTQTQVLLHDGDVVFGSLAIYKLIVLDLKPPPVNRTVKTMVTREVIDVIKQGRQ